MLIENPEENLSATYVVEHDILYSEVLLQTECHRLLTSKCSLTICIEVFRGK